MFKFKDRLPHLLMSSVIYQYSCRQCSSSYVGQTVKQFKVRISQHCDVYVCNNPGFYFYNKTPLS